MTKKHHIQTAFLIFILSLPVHLIAAEKNLKKLSAKQKQDDNYSDKHSINRFPSSDQLDLRFPVEKYQLKNGLTVLLNEDHSIPMVSFHTWYKVGSKEEHEGVTGAAHMLEHMMFKGAKKYTGKDFDRILHENGVTNNAFTTNDYTGFYENLPSSKLELIMDMEVDRMRSLAIRPEDLKSELQVVTEERRWRTDNTPTGRLREIFFAEIFKGHPYAWPVIGWMKDIEAYTSEKLRKFFDTYYVPNNAVLVLSGDFKSDAAKKLIAKYYDDLPYRSVPKAEVSFTKTPMQSSQKDTGHSSAVSSSALSNKLVLITKAINKEVKDHVQTPMMVLGFQSPESGQKESYQLDLLAELLGNGLSSRLHSKLVYESALASSVGAYNQTMKEAGVFTIQVNSRNKTNKAAIENMVWSEISNLQKKVVTDKELRKAKNRLLNQYVDGLTTIDGKAQALAINEILFGDYSRLFQDLSEYEAVTVEQIQSVAKKYLNKNQSVKVWLVP